MSSAETLGALLLFSAIATAGPAGLLAAGTLMVGAGILDTNEAIGDIGVAQSLEDLELSINRGFWAGTQAFLGATMIGWRPPVRYYSPVGPLQRANLPHITAARNVAGKWSAASSPRTGEIYVHSSHAEAIRLAQEGVVTRTGIKSGEVTLNGKGEVISTDWKKTW